MPKTGAKTVPPVPLDPLDWLARPATEDAEAITVQFRDKTHVYPALWDANGGATVRRRADFIRRVRDEAGFPRGLTPDPRALLDALGFLPDLPGDVALDLADWVNYRLSLAVAADQPLPRPVLDFHHALLDLFKDPGVNVTGEMPDA